MRPSKEEIVQFIKENQPVKANDILESLGYGPTVSADLTYLINMGELNLSNDRFLTIKEN